MDPNSITKPPTERWVWLAPDWSTSKPVTGPQPSGYTRVRVRDIPYADGRIVTVVLDKNGNPVAADGTPTDVTKARVLDQTMDDDQVKRFETAKSTTQRQTDQAERKRVSVTYEGTGADRKRRTVYESGADLVEDAPETAATSQTAAPGGAPYKDDGPEAGKTGRRWGWNAETRLYDRDLGPSPSAQKPDDPTDAIGKPTGNTRQRTEGNTTVKETEYVLPDGKREWRSQTATEAATAVDQVGKPTGNTRERTEGGAKVKETEYILPDGKREWRTQTAAGEPAGRKEEPYTHPKTGKQYTRVTETDPKTNSIRTYFVDPATKQEVTLDEGTNIKGVPSYTPDLTKPGAGLIDRAKQLDELVASGTITYQQRQEVLKNDQVLASTVANEFNVGVSILREDYQNQTSQRNADVQTANTRANLSNAHMQNAIGLVSKFMPYLGATEGDAGKLFMGMLSVQVAHATALGGLKDIPREHMDPTVMNAARRMVSGAGGPAPAVGTGTTPNAIGAGAVPASITPGAPTPAAAAITPPFAGGYDVNKFDQGPNGTLVPREFTPASSSSPLMQSLLGPEPAGPEANSWRQQALNTADMLSQPDQSSVALGSNLLGDTGMGQQQDAGMDFAPLPPVVDSALPGITPEIDAAARRELDMALMGGHY